MVSSSPRSSAIMPEALNVGKFVELDDSKLYSLDDLEQVAEWLNEVLTSFDTVEERLRFVLNEAAMPNGEKPTVAMTTSFGIHSALMLHLVKQATTESSSQQVPVVWVDTGYLPAETYHFSHRLKTLLSLDLHVYQGSVSPAMMEAMYGKLWEDPTPGAHKTYNYLRKVEPMNRALGDIGASMILSGLRAGQTSHRRHMKMVHVHDGRLKVCPILDWSEEQVSTYFAQHGLPYHPLHEKGYRSVGDWHSSQAYDPTVHKSERDTRFHGRTQECGLHLSSSDESIPDLLSSMSSISSSSTNVVTMDNGGFVLYTKPKCRYCRGAKALIEHVRKELIEHQHDELSLEEFQVGKDISRAELEHELGQPIKTVPQILYRGTYIGGFTGLVEWMKANHPQIRLPDTDKLVAKE